MTLPSTYDDARPDDPLERDREHVMNRVITGVLERCGF